MSNFDQYLKPETRPTDPLYPLLEKFTAEHDVAIPTVNLDPGQLDELRRMLVDWDTGNPIAAVIIERYGVDDEAES